jgi:hypothetical protein
MKIGEALEASPIFVKWVCEGLCRFFPSAFGSLGYHTLLNGFGGDAHVFHLTVNDHLDTLKIGHEAAFGDTSNVSTDAAFFLGFTTAPNVTSLNGPFTCNLTNPGHRAVLK